MTYSLKKITAIVGASLCLVSAQATILLNESFTYADGDLTNVSAGAWGYHSGAIDVTNDLSVVSGRAFINQNDGASNHRDYNRLLSTTFDTATDNSSLIYVGFTVNFAALPFNSGTSTAGSYFAHLKSTVANEFYARIGANQEGAAPGTFRLAITTEAWANGAGTVEYAQDLSLNVNYQVVMKYDLFTDRATLWVDPLSEASTSVISTDAPSYPVGNIINSFGLRQGTSNTTGAPGDIFVDDLIVGTSFVEVVPEPTSLCLVAIGTGAVLLRRRKA
jgi:hypothetical protein